MKIICGTDFSEHAEQASRAAAALAGRLGDTLVLANVWDETLGEGLWHDFHDRMSAAVRNRLYDHAVRLRKTGVSVEEEIRSGMPDVELAKLASGLDARLLVVGSLGRRSSEWLLGSVAEHVAVRAPVPTLVVRSAVPFEAWARGERPLKVFVAFDFTGTSEAALRWIKDLAAAGPCEVVVGYVDWPVGEAGRLGLTSPFFLSHNPPQLQRILERELSERISALLGEDVARIRVEPSLGRADVPLVEIAREEQADLVVAGIHQRHGLGRVAHPSISRGMLRDAPMSVACIPAARVETIDRQSAPIRRVLAASDLSEDGSLAIPYAYGAVSSGGVVRLLHVLEPSRVIEIPSREVVEAEERRRAQVPADAATRSIQTELAVIEGYDVAKTIRQEAERLGAHLVCIGSHGRSGLAKAVLGSGCAERRGSEPAAGADRSQANVMTARGIIKLVVPPCRTVDEGSRIQPDGSNVRQEKSTLKLHALLFGFSALLARASAHCDGLDGPVVQAARKALETGEVNLVLIWVQKPDEAEIKRAFDHAQAVRKLSAEAHELADRYFFETLVRIHRASEDAPFTGLKPTGRDLEPAIPAADNALRDGNAGGVQKLLIDSLDRGVREHFERARVAKDFDKNDVDAGRNFVKAYVEYIHCVEALRRRVPCMAITTKESRLLTMMKSELGRVSRES